MKKVLFLMIAISLFIGVSGVMAVDQPVQVGITADLTLAPSPSPLNFDSMKPAESKVIIITLTPGNSNLIVTPSVTAGFFRDNLKFDLGTGYKSIGTETIAVTAAVAKTFNSQLVIPVGFKAGLNSGTITYTVNEAT